MANDIQVHGGEGSFERMEGGDGVDAGSYWTASTNVDFGNSCSWTGGVYTYAGGSGTDSPEGKYVIPAGRTHLIERVKLAEGDVHTVVLMGHPSEGTSVRYEILARDFVRWFRPEHDAAAIRQREIAALQGRVAAIQNELVTRQNDPALDRELLAASGIDAAPLLAGPSAITGTSLVASAEGVSQQQLESARKAAEAQGKLAEAKAGWLTAKTKEISGTLAEIGEFYKEQAAAAIAQTSEVKRHVAHLESGLKTLGLYTGEGVEVLKLRDGEEASADVPLTVFQSKLFLDEESLINHLYGGADFRDAAEFAEMLQKDAGLVERILPTERCVVLMAYRREDRRYGDPVLDVLLNARNKAAFLLVRNGGLVWQVYSPVATHDSHLLFPAHDEISDKPFRGSGGDKVTVDSVKFSEALEKQQATILHYRRLLILLWGLNDRLQLLGTGFHDPAAHPKFLSLEFQEARFRFVADAENTLPSGRQALEAWIAEKNAHLASGSRVLCFWPNLINPDAAPGCAKGGADSRGHEWVDVRFKPKADFDCLVAAKDGPDLVVRPEVHSASSWQERSFSARVALRDGGFSRTRGDRRLAFLVLDAVSPEDIDWYVNSRAARKGYEVYIAAFMAAREILLADRRNEAAMRAAVAADIAEGLRLDPDAVSDTVDSAVRAWRASRRGQPLPCDPDSQEFRAAKKALLDQVYVGLGMGHDRAAAAEALAAERGRKPLRLCLSGRSKLVLYTEPAAAERLDSLVVDDPWAVRMVLEQRKTVLSVEREERAALPAVSPAAEVVLHEWPGAQAWAAKPCPAFPPSALQEAVAFCGAGRIAEVTAALDEAGFAAAHARVTAALKAARAEHGHDHHVQALMPVGVVRHEIRRTRWREGEGVFYYLLVARAGLKEMLYRKAPDSGRAAMEQSAGGAYYRDELRRSARNGLRVELVPLDKLIAGKSGARVLRALVEPGRELLADPEVELPYYSALFVETSEGFPEAVVAGIKKEVRYSDIAVDDIRWLSPGGRSRPEAPRGPAVSVTEASPGAAPGEA